MKPCDITKDPLSINYRKLDLGTTYFKDDKSVVFCRNKKHRRYFKVFCNYPIRLYHMRTYNLYLFAPPRRKVSLYKVIISEILIKG